MDQSAASYITQEQRDFFNSGKTKDVSFRIQQLAILKRAINDYEEEILKATALDMKKPSVEAYASEIGTAINEINYAIKNLKAWTKPKKVKIPLVNTTSFGITQHFLVSSHIYSEPLGVMLIIGPWNYPFNLTINPLVGAIAAGNCSIIKPSEIAPHVSHVIAEMIKVTFDAEYISVIEGGVETAQELLSEKFDHIFFTGGTYVGKIVMEAAAKNLTPVTLELGGKNPCIVDHEVHIEYAAKRIVYGKFFNAGQTCVAPDYLLVDKTIKRELLEAIKKYIKDFYGSDPCKSTDYARIINEKHFDRLCELLTEGNIIMGGDTHRDDCYIGPTIIVNSSLDHKIMNDEIFGPILPVIDYHDLNEAISIVNKYPKSLAVYLFSNNREKQERVLRETSSGGVCINDTSIHIFTTTLPFGGVGDSGIGNYHGKASFDTFSHKKSVMKKSFLFDINLRYPPYKDKFKYMKKMNRFL